ncbi:MAG TPA: hypothetical protein VG871_13160, partial [Vicinamibacterales bacterium]|nr:hypothetical protein [Vicinamibacterales bacterium]
PNATIYCPDAAVPFTRITEPRNRSAFMAPSGKTSLSIEIPCWFTDSAWKADDATLMAQCLDGVSAMGLIDRAACLGGVVHRLPHAYPVLETGSTGQIATVQRHLASFSNLHMAGRTGRFAYVHVHDLMRAGRELAARLASH